MDEHLENRIHQGFIELRTLMMPMRAKGWKNKPRTRPNRMRLRKVTETAELLAVKIEAPIQKLMDEKFWTEKEKPELRRVK